MVAKEAKNKLELTTLVRNEVKSLFDQKPIPYLN